MPMQTLQLHLILMFTVNTSLVQISVLIPVAEIIHHALLLNQLTVMNKGMYIAMAVHSASVLIRV